MLQNIELSKLGKERKYNINLISSCIQRESSTGKTEINLKLFTQWGQQSRSTPVGWVELTMWSVWKYMGGVSNKVDSKHSAGGSIESSCHVCKSLGIPGGGVYLFFNLFFF